MHKLRQQEETKPRLLALASRQRHLRTNLRHRQGMVLPKSLLRSFVATPGCGDCQCKSDAPTPMNLRLGSHAHSRFFSTKRKPNTGSRLRKAVYVFPSAESCFAWIRLMALALKGTCAGWPAVARQKAMALTVSVGAKFVVFIFVC